MGRLHRLLYIGISVLVTPIFRKRLDEKFNRGSENQSFLVESINGIETLKAMAVEPQMQRRWEEQLAGYVGASFRVLSLGNWSSQVVQLVNKLVTAAILFFGAMLPIGLLMRMSGKDFLRLARDPSAPTYWLPRVDERPQSESMKQQF